MPRLPSGFGLALMLAVAGSSMPAAAETAPPRTVVLPGQELTLARCGSRDVLWMDIYAVALYLPRPGLRRRAIFEDATAKVVRVYPVYDGELPQRIPDGWRERLQRRLPPELMAIVEDFFARITTTDVITVTYQPGVGTVLMINERVFRRVAGSLLMHAILEIWLGTPAGGGDPVDLDWQRC